MQTVHETSSKELWHVRRSTPDPNILVPQREEGPFERVVDDLGHEAEDGAASYFERFTWLVGENGYFVMK